MNSLKACSAIFTSILDYLNRDRDAYFKEYYEHWMHTGSKVRVAEESEHEEFEVMGLDDYGYLSLRRQDGTFFSVQPDGNSFDITHNLISTKARR